MNSPTLVLAIAVCIAFPLAYADGDSLPAGTIQKGTLANGQLIQDAKLGVAAKAGALGCDKPESIDPYVVAMPTGKVGARRWKEKWLISGCGKKYPIDIEFSEDGPYAANYSIVK